MTTLADFKKQNPAYAEVPDDQLVVALHKKYYSSMPFGDFAVKVGMAGPNPAENVDSTLKIYNPFGDNFDTGMKVGTNASNVLSGMGKALVDIKRGIQQVGGANNQQEIDESRRLDAPLMKTTAGVVGNVAGNMGALAGTSLIPGANTVVGGGVVGSLLGSLSPVATGESRLDSTVMGGVGGAAGSAIAKGLSRVISPKTSPDVKKLIGEGVDLTPGQIGGGMWKAVEDKLTSVPLLGDAIRSGQRRSVEQFNRAAYNRALSPIGQKATGAVGREGVENVSDALSDAYNKLLPKVSFTADQPFAQELSAVRQMAQNLPEAQAKRFEKILETELLGKMTPAGKMSGKTLKEVEGQLGTQARGYMGDPSFDNRQLSDALKEVQAIVRRTLERSNPNQAAELKAINTGFANYDRIRRAASSQGNEGVFTPKQMSAAVRSQDKSVGKGTYAKGNAMMQDLTDAGRSVIGDTYPNSGTAGRLLMAGSALGGAGQVAAGMGAAPMLGPAGLGILGLTAAGSLPYTALGQKVMTGLLARRPDIAAPIGQIVGGYAPELGIIGSSYALQK